MNTYTTNHTLHVPLSLAHRRARLYIHIDRSTMTRLSLDTSDLIWSHRTYSYQIVPHTPGTIPLSIRSPLLAENDPSSNVET